MPIFSDDEEAEFNEFVKGLCVQKGIEYKDSLCGNPHLKCRKCEECCRSYYELYYPAHDRSNRSGKDILEYYYWPEKTLITEPADSVGWELIDAVHLLWTPQGIYDSGLCSRKCAIKLFSRDFRSLDDLEFDEFYNKAVEILGLADPANMKSKWAKVFLKLVADRNKQGNSNAKI